MHEISAFLALKKLLEKSIKRPPQIFLPFLVINSSDNVSPSPSCVKKSLMVYRYERLTLWSRG